MYLPMRVMNRFLPVCLAFLLVIITTHWKN
jgi:hypothetical protein